MIELKDIFYAYHGRQALDGISLTIDEGEHVALIGPNASGKTTLARIMDALLIPDDGDCIVDGVNTRKDPMYARRAVGMVFQDPESQVVARHIRDDVGFGPRNLGLRKDEVDQRIVEALDAVDMAGFLDQEVSSLSGGRKQLLAIAGVLAMRPSYVILDEPTALLDGRGTQLVRDAIAGLKKKGVGLVIITHDMDEASRADRVIALCQGRIRADTTPESFFSDEALMADIGVKPPFSVKVRKAAGPLLANEVSRICR